MNRTTRHAFVALTTALLLAPLAALHAGELSQSAARIELLSTLWLFNTTQPAQSILATQAPQAALAAPADATRGFTIKLTVNLKQTDREKEMVVTSASRQVAQFRMVSKRRL